MHPATVYLWVGGLYLRSLSPVGPTADHVGDLAMYSLVVGYRPPFFREDFPKPDWRFFLETMGEWWSAPGAMGTSRALAGIESSGPRECRRRPGVSRVHRPERQAGAENVRWVVNVMLWFWFGGVMSSRAFLLAVLPNVVAASAHVQIEHMRQTVFGMD